MLVFNLVIFLSFDISQFRFIAESSIALYHKRRTSRIALWHNSRSHQRIHFKVQDIDSCHFRLRRSMQSDTNSSKSSSKNVSRRARRSRNQYKTSTSCLKKSESHQKANHSKDFSNHSSKRRVQRHRRCSKDVKARQMS